MRTQFFIQMEWPNGVEHPTNPGGTHWETVMETTSQNWKRDLGLCKVKSPNDNFQAIRQTIMPAEVMGMS